jgi:hypothetical protein
VYLPPALLKASIHLSELQFAILFWVVEWSGLFVYRVGMECVGYTRLGVNRAADLGELRGLLRWVLAPHADSWIYFDMWPERNNVQPGHVYR